ncbi:MAG: type II secretion system F family protein [Planctomycetota bacterium]|nr:type II secretion system F family protein [Planctomycetota bacterium]MDA1162784.1 type II secretion system F family protein [Planctomycetota bacterium]
MSDQPATGSAAVRLEELLALNEEIGALIRAGVPLELGLRQYGDSIPGGLGRFSNRLADRISTGLSLQEALDEEGDHLPGVYRAVVEAGLRAGRLPEALEALSVVALSLLKLHRQIMAALIYPVIVLGMVWLALIGFAQFLLPVFLDTWDGLRLQPGPAVEMLIFLRSSMPVWGIGIPVLVCLGFVGLVSAGRRNSETSAGRLVEQRLHRFAWMPGVVKNYEHATFLQMLSLLVEHETPLHEALVLAGYSTGNRQIILDSTSIAQRLKGGESLEASLKAATRLPRFLRWMLRAGAEHGKLNETLKLAADVYQKRASRRAELLKVVLPVVLTVFVAGGVTLLYGVILFAPIRELYERLADPLT